MERINVPWNPHFTTVNLTTIRSQKPKSLPHTLEFSFKHFFFSVSHPFSRGLNMVETPKRDIEMKPTFFRNRRSQFPKLLFYPKRFLPWESLRVLIGNFFQCSFWSFLVLLLRLRRQICRNPPWDSVFCALTASGSLLSYNGCYKWYLSSKWVAIASWIT